MSIRIKTSPKPVTKVVSAKKYYEKIIQSLWISLRYLKNMKDVMVKNLDLYNDYQLVYTQLRDMIKKLKESHNLIHSKILSEKEKEITKL